MGVMDYRDAQPHPGSEGRGTLARIGLRRRSRFVCGSQCSGWASSQSKGYCALEKMRDRLASPSIGDAIRGLLIGVRSGGFLIPAFGPGSFEIASPSRKNAEWHRVVAKPWTLKNHAMLPRSSDCSCNDLKFPCNDVFASPRSSEGIHCRCNDMPRWLHWPAFGHPTAMTPIMLASLAHFPA